MTKKKGMSDFLENVSDEEIDISFFVPCLNEQENISRTLDEIIAAVESTSLTYEIIVVDDKSEDLTKQTVKEYIEKNKERPIFLRENKVNLGLGRNFVDVSFVSRGEYYMSISGDNADSKESILKILKEMGKADMVIPFLGSNDNRSWFRRNLSRIFTFVVNLTSGYKIKYYNGPVIHKKYNVMRWSPYTHGFASQAEIIVKVLDERGSFVEVEIESIDRKKGASKAFTIKNIFSVTHSLFQIFLRRLGNLF